MLRNTQTTEMQPDEVELIDMGMICDNKKKMAEEAAILEKQMEDLELTHAALERLKKGKAYSQDRSRSN